MHPLTGQRLDLWRLKNFDGTRLPASAGHVPVPPGRPRTTRPTSASSRSPRSAASQPVATTPATSSPCPAIERDLAACLDGIRRAQAATRQQAARRQPRRPLRVAVLDVPLDGAAHRRPALAPLTVGRRPRGDHGDRPAARSAGREPREKALRFSYRSGAGVVARSPSRRPSRCGRSTSTPRRCSAREARGTVYPYELIPLLTGRGGTFAEYDLDETGVLAPVERPYGQNTRRHHRRSWSPRRPTAYPEGMTRVALFGDPTKALGTVAEAECSRIVAGHRPGREDGRARSNGSHCPPAPRSRWTAAPRTWTGSPAACAASSPSPRPAARSTSSSPASTSARSRTGTPKPRCSCTPRASW